MSTSGTIGTGFRAALPFSWSLAVVPVLAVMALDVVPAFVPWVIPWVALPLLPYVAIARLIAKRGVPVLDPGTPRPRLFWHAAILWAWALSYPSLVVLTVWAASSSPTLTVYERLVLVFFLAQLPACSITVAHEMLHSRGKWTRRLGELVMGSVALPHWYTEHFHVHHPYVGTPLDRTSAPQGRSIYDHLLKTFLGTYIDAVRIQHRRMARRGLSFWHRSNHCWRWAAVLVAWIGASLAIGGLLGFAVWCFQAFVGIFTLRAIDYVQHYGLQRGLLPSGRYERVRPHHSWNFSDATDSLLLCLQRHSDHHLHAARPYALLQEHAEDAAPQLPSNYPSMVLLALRPYAWFRKMDPLVAEWRRRFNPDIRDWRGLSSRAYRERPKLLQLIVEMFRSAPRLAEWVERHPHLLDEIESWEFQQLVVPGNIGLEPDVALAAQRGILRLYYTREFGRDEMTQQLALTGLETSEEVIESVQYWSDANAFRAGVRMMRGNILPVDAGLPLSNMAEVAISAVARDVLNDLKGLYGPISWSGVAIAAFGGLGNRHMTMRSDVELLLLHEEAEPEGGRYVPGVHARAICERLNALLAELAKESILFRSIKTRLPRGERETSGSVASGPLEAFAGEGHDAHTVQRLAEVASARLVFVTGEGTDSLERRFHCMRRTTLARHADAALRELPNHRPGPGSVDPSIASVLSGPGGLSDTMLAALLLRLRFGEDHPAVMKAQGLAEVFEAAGEQRTVEGRVAGDLADAARLWLNLDGIRPLVAAGNLEESGLDESCRATIARACDAGSIGELQAVAVETAARTAAHIDALVETA